MKNQDRISATTDYDETLSFIERNCAKKGIPETLYASFSCPKLFTRIRTAEMIKYVSNAFATTHIFMLV